MKTDKEKKKGGRKQEGRWRHSEGPQEGRVVAFFEDAKEGIAITQIAALFSPASGLLPAEEHQDSGANRRGGEEWRCEDSETFTYMADRTGIFRGCAQLPSFHSIARTIWMDSTNVVFVVDEFDLCLLVEA